MQHHNITWEYMSHVSLVTVILVGSSLYLLSTSFISLTASIPLSCRLHICVFIVWFSSGSVLLLGSHVYLYTLVSPPLWLALMLSALPQGLTARDWNMYRGTHTLTLTQINTTITPSHYLAAVEPRRGLITGRQGWLLRPGLNTAGKWQIFLASESWLKVRTIP